MLIKKLELEGIFFQTAQLMFNKLLATIKKNTLREEIFFTGIV